MHPVSFVADRTRSLNVMVQPTKQRNVDSPPMIEPDWAKENKVQRFDRDVVEIFGLKAARFVMYLECWLNGKVKRDSRHFQYTYDPAWLICQRTGLKTATLERIVKKLSTAKFIRLKPGDKNVRHYALADQNEYYSSREDQKHVFALRADADLHGEAVAILLFNLRHWNKQNKDERVRLFQGRFWRHDSVNNLVWQFSGFLTKKQLRVALAQLHDKRLVDMIAYYDANGVRQDGKFWITLMEIPPVDDYEPLNKVRPASLFTRDGKLIAVEIDAEKSRITGDKTALPNDKTPLPDDKTETARNGHQPSQNEDVTGEDNPPLNDNPLIVPSEVAGAPSDSTQVRVSDNLPQSEQSARPSASRKPSASSADCPTAGDRSAFSLRRMDELEANFGKLTRQVQQLALSSQLKSARGMDKNGWLENFSDLHLRIPRSDLRNFLRQFSGDKDNAVKLKASGSSLGVGLQLQDEMRQVSMNKIPRECFGNRYGDPHLNCKRCPWAKSCMIGTPVEIREAIRDTSLLNSPDWNVQRESDRPDNVADTYRACYREVFGTEAPDTVGQADAIYRHAQHLKQPVRLFCLIYMASWANTHPRQKFFARYLSGEGAFENVKMVTKLCDQKFGTVLEDRLAMVLHLQFTDDLQPLWRHQPTPMERFMVGWRNACAEAGIKDYNFQRQEVKELMSFTDDFRLKEAEDLLDKATEWLMETTREKTLMVFLCEIQNKPLPEPEIEVGMGLDYKRPWYESNIDEGEEEYDFTLTRAYGEEIDRKFQIARQKRPDSGSEFVAQTMDELNLVKAPKRGKRSSANTDAPDLPINEVPEAQVTGHAHPEANSKLAAHSKQHTATSQTPSAPAIRNPEAPKRGRRNIN